jgi:hypothetical protein
MGLENLDAFPSDQGSANPPEQFLGFPAEHDP